MEPAMDTLEITATDFKAKCLELFDRVASGKLKRVTVTKRGKPVAVVMPPQPKGKQPSFFGYMKGTVNLPPDFDLTEPVIEPFEVDDTLVRR
jgi:prevent-host-death family protein